MDRGRDVSVGTVTQGTGKVHSVVSWAQLMPNEGEGKPYLSGIALACLHLFDDGLGAR